MKTYSYFAVQYAVAVSRVAGLPTSAGRAGPVAVESAVRPAPNSALPVLRNSLILGLPRRKLETGGLRSVSRLCRDSWPYIVWAVVRDKQWCNVQLSSVEFARRRFRHMVSSTRER